MFLTDDYCGHIDFEEIAEISKDSLKTIWKNSKIPRFVSPVKNGVKIYHVNYYTKWVNGEKIKASGRYYVPLIEFGYPLVIYNHGTRVKKGRPKLKGGENKICLIFSADGYGVLSPDYIGLGEGDKNIFIVIWKVKLMLELIFYLLLMSLIVFFN